jgi:hypothetical protein
MRAATRRPHWCICDIIPIGRLSGEIFKAPSVLGVSPYTRVMTMLQEHFPAFAFRGLARAEALRQAGPVLENAVANFGVDISWLTAIARHGELHRVAEPLYQKRYHDRNTETQWWSLPKHEQLRSWAHHCVDMLRVALEVGGSPEQSRLLWFGAAARLTAPEAARIFSMSASLRPRTASICCASSSTWPRRHCRRRSRCGWTWIGRHFVR